MKAIIAVLLVALTLSLTDKEIIQTSLDGAFEQNKLPKPTTIVKCIDDTSAHQIVVFAKQVLDKAARGSISDLLSLKQLIEDFGNSLNPDVGTCLDGNAELAALGVKYNPKNESSDAIEKKVITYVTLHYITVHKWLGELDDLWNAANYYQVGFKGAGYGHTILGSTLEVTNLYEVEYQTSRHIHAPEVSELYEVEYQTSRHVHEKPSHSHIMKLLKEIKHLQEALKL